MVGASPANSALLQDEPTVKAFNEMNFEYGTLGYHEFDEGLGEFSRIMKGEAPEPGKFNKIVDEYTHEASKQEVVIANLVDKETNEIPFGWKPYTIKEIPVNGKTAEVGFIEVVTTEFPNLVLRKNHEQFHVLDEAESIAKYAKVLNAQGVHAIAVLAHVAATSKNGIAKGPAADMIKKLNEIYPKNSVDLVFAGHNHQYTNGLAGKTLIVQGTSQGKAYSDVWAVLDTDTGDFVTTPTAKIIAVDSSKGKEKNTKLQVIIDNANETVKKVTEAKIGTAEKAENITAHMADGTEIDRTKTYTAVFNDFLLGGGDGFSVFRDTKLIGALDPDTEVFIQYIQDMEKAGKKLTASILGNKVFVEKVEEEKSQPEPQPQPLPQPQPAPVVPETPAHEEKPSDQPLSSAVASSPVVEEASVKTIAVSYHTGASVKEEGTSGLPKTGQDELASVLLSLFGMTSLVLAGMLISKKCEDN